jgi:beta-lactamase regulating signal transducer with metallopeptidase domain
MNLSYAGRLWCLSLACFFLLHFALGLAMAWAAPCLIRRADRMPARRAARLLLAARLAPVVVSILAVVGLCVPSYLWLEPDAGEDVSVACLTAAILAMVIAGYSVARSVRAISRSRAYIRHCHRAGHTAAVAGASAILIEGSGHLVRLAGVFRPRVVISRDVVNALSADQLEAALRHEQVHRCAFDNLKRFFVLLAPDLLPFFRGGFDDLERGWARFTEWAADDESVAGDPHRSLSLAAALVSVARLDAASQPPLLVTSLLAGDLAARIERLLHMDESPARHPKGSTPALAAGASILAAVAVAAVWFHAAALASIHELLEHLVN